MRPLAYHRPAAVAALGAVVLAATIAAGPTQPAAIVPLATQEIVIFDDNPASAAATCDYHRREDPETTCTVRPAAEAPLSIKRKAARPIAQPQPATAVVLVAGERPSGARAELAELVVRTEDTGAHYRRTEWGAWSSDRAGCDTRERILRRDAAPGSVRIGPGCQVLAGRWLSPYDQTTSDHPASVQIDHRVPLAEANRSGARGWTRAQREQFANDPANLVAVSARANTSKGDRDPGRWRPPYRGAWCAYAAGYIATKHTYRLTIDSAEHAALTAMLNTCPAGVAR